MPQASGGQPGTSHLWVPETGGFLACTSDPLFNTQDISPSNGYLQAMLIPNRRTITVTNLIAYCSIPGTNMSGYNGAALFKADGTLIAKSADQAANWAAAGVKVIPLVVEPGQSLVQSDNLIGALMTNGTGVSPSFRGFAFDILTASIGVVAPAYRSSYKLGAAFPGVLGGATSDSHGCWLGLS